MSQYNTDKKIIDECRKLAKGLKGRGVSNQKICEIVYIDYVIEGGSREGEPRLIDMLEELGLECLKEEESRDYIRRKIWYYI